MAKKWQITLNLSGSNPSTVNFTIEGAFRRRLTPIYNQAMTDPREVAVVREVWYITGARIQAATATAMWQSGSTLTTLMNQIKTRRASGAGGVTSATFVLDPTAITPTTPMTISEGFQVDDFQTDIDPDMPEETYLTTCSVDMVLSANNRLADSRGISVFEQTIRDAEINGLQTLQYTTDIITAEGTDARGKVEIYGKIPNAFVSSRHAWETNNAAGVHVEVTDKNGSLTRVPTAARGVSRIQEHGVTVGASAPGSSPNAVSVIYTDELDDKGNSVLTTEVSAQGPNAELWAQPYKPENRKPGSVEIRDPSTQSYSARWVTRRNNDILQDLWVIGVTISGGDRKSSDEEVCNGSDPVEFFSPPTMWWLEVDVSQTFHGAAPALMDMAFPPILKDPWKLDKNKSVETDPSRVTFGEGLFADEWVRTAKAKYKSKTNPGTDNLMDQLTAATGRVASYKR